MDLVVSAFHHVFSHNSSQQMVNHKHLSENKLGILRNPLLLGPLGPERCNPWSDWLTQLPDARLLRSQAQESSRKTYLFVSILRELCHVFDQQAIPAKIPKPDSTWWKQEWHCLENRDFSLSVLDDCWKVLGWHLMLAKIMTLQDMCHLMSFACLPWGNFSGVPSICVFTDVAPMHAFRYTPPWGSETNSTTVWRKPAGLRGGPVGP